MLQQSMSTAAFKMLKVFCLYFVCALRWAHALSPEDGVLEWLSAHGGAARGVGVASFEGMGRGVVALRNIREGDEVLRIPSMFARMLFGCCGRADVM